MPGSEFFEALPFGGGKSFNVSRRVNTAYIHKQHWHPFVELLVSLSDQNVLSVNYTKYHLKTNDVVIIYPGDMHSIDECTEDSLLIIQFSSDLLNIMFELASSMALFTQHTVLKYDPACSANEVPVMLLKEFCETYDMDIPFREVHMYALLLRFFELCGRIFMKNQDADLDETVGTRNRTVKKVAETCLYISQNCTKPLTLAEAAEYMGVSKSHFAHVFKEYTNTTFVDYLTEERIKRAQALFRRSDIQIIDIAFESGFTSISSFNRSFKKITGLSPSQFRDNMIMRGDHSELEGE